MSVTGEANPAPITATEVELRQWQARIEERCRLLHYERMSMDVWLAAMVEYHMSVLRERGLLPPTPPELG